MTTPPAFAHLPGPGGSYPATIGLVGRWAEIDAPLGTPIGTIVTDEKTVRWVPADGEPAANALWQMTSWIRRGAAQGIPAWQMFDTIVESCDTQALTARAVIGGTIPPELRQVVIAPPVGTSDKDRG